MNEPQDNAPVSDLALERYRLGELPPSEMTRLDERLDVDPELSARLEALATSDEAIRRAYPPSEVQREIRARLAERRPVSATRLKHLWLAPVAIVAGAALWLSLDISSTRSVAPAVRVKGSLPQLVLFRKTEAGSERVTDRDHARPGDLIRIAYRADGHAYGVILSIDGRGALTLHWPVDADAASPLETSGTVLLDFAYELDDAPRWERFYLVTGAKPFAIAPVMRAAARLATSPPSENEPHALDLPDGLDVSVISLLKEE